MWKGCRGRGHSFYLCMGGVKGCGFLVPFVYNVKNIQVRLLDCVHQMRKPVIAKERKFPPDFSIYLILIARAYFKFPLSKLIRVWPLGL